MIRTTLAAAALLLAAPVQAGVILPNIFAQTFCDARSIGIDRKDAIDMALRAATINGEPQMVTYNGRQERADLITASMTVVRRCPQY